MFIQVDREHEEKYIYQQIYEGIKTAILQRELPMGHKLPSKRQLAVALQVSINSVRFAYEQLLAEGYIYTVERKGYFVEQLSLLDVDAQVAAMFPLDLKEQVKDDAEWISFSHMSTNSELFPYKSWMKHQESAVEQFSFAFGEMSEPQGPYTVRQSIARLIYSTRGVKCEPEQIILHASSQGLLEQLLFLQSNDAIFALENPGYARFYHVLQKHQREVEIIPLAQNGVDLRVLERSRSNFLITTPSHQFPTGKIMPVSTRIELLNWALEQENRYIIEDDYDSEFKYKTDNIPSLQSLDCNQRVIYMGTFSKTLLPGMRICYMILPPKLLVKYRENAQLFMQPANILSLYTLQKFIESGAYEKHVRKMNHYYEKLRALLIEQLRQRFGEKLELTDIPAGLHFLIRVKTMKTYEDIEQAAKCEKLELYTMRRFLIEPVPFYVQNRFIVIGFARLKVNHIDEAITRLERVLFA